MNGDDFVIVVEKTAEPEGSVVVEVELEVEAVVVVAEAVVAKAGCVVFVLQEGPQPIAAAVKALKAKLVSVSDDAKNDPDAVVVGQAQKAGGVDDVVADVANAADVDDKPVVVDASVVVVVVDAEAVVAVVDELIILYFPCLRIYEDHLLVVHDDKT